MPYEEHELAPATVLRGHVDEDTAYLVEDYPYGYQLRCQIRYWLHTAESGAKQGQLRFVSQTTNPKVDGHPWNKPKTGTYRPWAVMYRDSLGHVEWWPVGPWGPNPWEHLRFRLRGMFDQLDETERAGYLVLLQAGLTEQPDTWERAKRAHAAVAAGATADQLLDHGLYLDERDHQIAVAAHAAGLTF